MNNVKYESTNILENKLIFSVTIKDVKYTAFTDYDLNVINVAAPISMEEWIKQRCTSNVILHEAPSIIQAAAQHKISNWWYKNQNYFDKFYSSKSV